MTLGESSILFTLVVLIITTIIKTIKESSSADALQKTLNKVLLALEAHSSKIDILQTDVGTLKKRIENHDEDFKHVRESVRNLKEADYGV